MPARSRHTTARNSSILDHFQSCASSCSQRARSSCSRFTSSPCLTRSIRRFRSTLSVPARRGKKGTMKRRKSGGRARRSCGTAPSL
eukprot:1551291-Pyramimonas_sp.AAC.1